MFKLPRPRLNCSSSDVTWTRFLFLRDYTCFLYVTHLVSCLLTPLLYDVLVFRFDGFKLYLSLRLCYELCGFKRINCACRALISSPKCSKARLLGFYILLL